MNSTINRQRVGSFGVRDGLPRWLEFPITLVVLILILPLLLLVALVVKLTSPGSVLFKQRRVGHLGKKFVLYKFRTMRIESSGPQITIKKDNRITWIGGILRRTKLDELPELWNIVRGDMSIVGPRPEVPDFVSLENPLWQEVLQVRPGITDPVTLRLRNEEEMLAAAKNPVQYYLEILQPEKLQGYLNYLQCRTWKSDLRVIKETFVAIIFPFETPSPMIEDEHRQVDIKQKTGFFFSILNFGRIKILADLVILVAAFFFSYLLRFEFAIPGELLHEAFLQMLVVVLFQYIVLHISGISNFIWRYISIAELGVFIRAAIIFFFPFILFRLLNFGFLPELRVPLSVSLMDGICAFGGLMGIRIFRRLMYERYEKRQISTKTLSANRKPLFLIGAGRAGQMAAREIIGRGTSNFDVIGFIDDDVSKLGKVISGVKVCGTTKDLPRLTKEMAVENAILTISDAHAEALQRIIAVCEKAELNLRIMPGLYKLLDAPLFNGNVVDSKVEAYLKKTRGSNENQEPKIPKSFNKFISE